MPPLDEIKSAPAEANSERGVKAKAAKVAQRAKESAPVRIYSRLTAVDFMNSAFNFSVLIVVCLFPVLVIISDLTGRDIRHTIITRMGLNAQAAKDVDGLIGSGRGALATLTVIGAAFLVLCAVGIASTLQSW